MKIYSGKVYLPFIVALGIWSVSALTALPGLAVSPIMGDLQKIFPHAGEMEIQMLTSLPSLLILPFILLSGYLTQRVNIYKLLMTGLLIFGATGVLYLLSTKMWQLVLVSALLGIGAGIIIPLSTGLITLFFSGESRTRQFGLNSSISNLTVVAATLLTGYLAGIDWKLPFLVYLLPFAAVFLAMPLKKYWPADKDMQEEEKYEDKAGDRSEFNIIIGKYGMDIKHLWHIMALYGSLTFTVAIVIFYIPFLVSGRGMSEDLSGSIISLFFLAIMLPGLFLNRIISVTKERTILLAIMFITLGLFLISVTGSAWVISLAAVLVGLGYGTVQPLCYDKAMPVSSAKKHTVALACVMFMNYVAILLCPFVIDGIKDMLDIQGNVFSFRLGTGIALIIFLVALARSKKFVFNIMK